MKSDYQELVRERILNRRALTRAVFSGQQKGASLPWTKVVVRPVEIRGELHLQFSYFDEKKDITKNYLEEAASKVDELLALPFRNIFVESSDGNLQVNISKKGRTVVSEPKFITAPVADLAHDHQKNRLLSAENAEPFLKAVGIMTSNGRIRAARMAGNIHNHSQLPRNNSPTARPASKALQLRPFGRVLDEPAFGL